MNDFDKTAEHDWKLLISVSPGLVASDKQAWIHIVDIDEGAHGCNLKIEVLNSDNRVTETHLIKRESIKSIKKTIFPNRAAIISRQIYRTSGSRRV